MERMESMEPISAYYTTAYPEIQPDSTYGSRETTESQAMTPPPPTYDEELVHKTILVGDSGVGKTSLLVQFDQGKFIPGSFSATVGIGFTIWDTAGQERFRSVTHAYYRDAHALLLLYDITSKSSFDNIRAWLTEIHEYAQSNVVIMLLGNKADMSSDRAIRRDEGERLAREYSVPFMETSAKTGVNVDLAFTAVAKELKHRAIQHPSEPKFQIHEYIEAQKEKSGCCSYF
uniref:RAB37, member RAS onco family n=1 Tax=Oreochromis niloticus TaxID=8128 RepID=A0A669CF96_ORENI